MGKFKAKHKDKFNCAIRQKHISRFLILAVLMVAGIFLILPASTAQGWPFDDGDTGLDTPDRDMEEGMAPDANQPPVISDLESSPSSPQLAGSTIRWTARAKDPEGEPLSFLFQVKGPYTGGSWRTIADWSSENRFVWDTSSYSAGDYEIKVRVEDRSLGEAEKTAYFQLNEPEPQPREIKEEARPAPVEEQPFAPTIISSPYQEENSYPDQSSYPQEGYADQTPNIEQGYPGQTSYQEQGYPGQTFYPEQKIEPVRKSATRG